MNLFQYHNPLYTTPPPESTTAVRCSLLLQIWVKFAFIQARLFDHFSGQKMPIFFFPALHVINSYNPADTAGVSFPLRVASLCPFWDKPKFFQNGLDIIPIQKMIHISNGQSNEREWFVWRIFSLVTFLTLPKRIAHNKIPNPLKALSASSRKL